MNANILLNDRPLLIPPTLAVLLGTNESIILQQIHYWLKRSKQFKLGRKWVYLTYDQLAEQIPFISKSTIRRTILKLEKQGYLLPQNFNKLKIDKTKWYSIHYENLEELIKERIDENQTIGTKDLFPSDIVEEMVCSEQADDIANVDSPAVQIEQSSDSTWHVEELNLNTPIPETTTEITPKTTSETSSSKETRKDEVKEDPFRFFEQNGFGTIGSFLEDKIKTWCNDVSDELVIEAMKLAVENSSKRWNYVEAVLRDWVDKGYQTSDEVYTARLAYKQKANHHPRKKPIRQELLPDWIYTQDKDDEPNQTPSSKEKKRLIDERLKKYREGSSTEVEPVHNFSFEEKKRLFEERLKKSKV
ncbi:DnaD domain-containing protein [Bacillus sinesaloumensis]|uniref:DnaD domain-containing protein n=1 Tax=Litchfieldia sinesaloumensis TaxID=1926280 RepID=UPI0009883EE8|nr:DnaD domain protein [Bacillus sinesaloumensis]